MQLRNGRWSLAAVHAERRRYVDCRGPVSAGLADWPAARSRACVVQSDVSCRKTSLAYDSTRPTPPIESHKQTNTVARMPSKSNSRLRGFMRGKKRSTVKRFMTRQIPFVCLFCLFYSWIHVKKEKQNFAREAQLEKHKTTVWIKWPTQGRATYV